MFANFIQFQRFDDVCWSYVWNDQCQLAKILSGFSINRMISVISDNFPRKNHRLVGLQGPSKWKNWTPAVWTWNETDWVLFSGRHGSCPRIGVERLAPWLRFNKKRWTCRGGVGGMSSKIWLTDLVQPKPDEDNYAICIHMPYALSRQTTTKSLITGDDGILSQAEGAQWRTSFVLGIPMYTPNLGIRIPSSVLGWSLRQCNNVYNNM